MRAAKLNPSSCFVGATFCSGWPLVPLDCVTYRLPRNAHRKSYVAVSFPVCFAISYFFLPALEPMKATFNICKQALSILFFAYQERKNLANNLFAFSHCANAPYPNIPFIDSVRISCSSLTPNRAAANAREDCINHAPVSVPNRNGDATVFRIDGIEKRPLTVQDSSKPAKPLVISHFWHRVDGGIWHSNSFHVATVYHITTHGRTVELYGWSVPQARWLAERFTK